MKLHHVKARSHQQHVETTSRTILSTNRTTEQQVYSYPLSNTHTHARTQPFYGPLGFCPGHNGNKLPLFVVLLVKVGWSGFNGIFGTEKAMSCL